MTPTHTWEDEQRDHHLARAHVALETVLPPVGQLVSWDHMLVTALKVPMIAEPDVKAWLKEQQRLGRVEVLGLGSGRVPVHGRGHTVRRLK